MICVIYKMFAVTDPYDLHLAHIAGCNRYTTALTLVLLEIVSCVNVHPGNIHRNHMYPKDYASLETGGRCVTQLANITIEPKFIELTIDVFVIFLLNIIGVLVFPAITYYFSP